MFSALSFASLQNKLIAIGRLVLILTIAIFVVLIPSIGVSDDVIFSSTCQGHPSKEVSDIIDRTLLASKEISFEKKDMPFGAIFTIIPESDKYIKINGSCYVEVSVYVNEKDHFSIWRTFSVSNIGRILLQNADGEYE